MGSDSFFNVLNSAVARLKSYTANTGDRMHQPEDNSVPTVSYLLEHSHGTCELWIKRSQGTKVRVYEPLRLLRVSGHGVMLLRTEVIAEAILLEEWMADHFEVFDEGRTSYE